MSALAFLQAEVDIIVRESEGAPWMLDPPHGLWPAPPHVMTPGLMRARLVKLVDEYEHEGSLSFDEIAIVRKAIDGALERVTREFESRLSPSVPAPADEATKCEKAAHAPSRERGGLDDQG